MEFILPSNGINFRAFRYNERNCRPPYKFLILLCLSFSKRLREFYVFLQDKWLDKLAAVLLFAWAMHVVVLYMRPVGLSFYRKSCN